MPNFCAQSVMPKLGALPNINRKFVMKNSFPFIKRFLIDWFAKRQMRNVCAWLTNDRVWFQNWNAVSHIHALYWQYIQPSICIYGNIIAMRFESFILYMPEWINGVLPSPKITIFVNLLVSRFSRMPFCLPPTKCYLWWHTSICGVHDLWISNLFLFSRWQYSFH